ncbi:unnamed protein product [Lactuca virosa]|uniref:Uncharacterized protein n=1 Tax=Lactuca virosa TaxID=75947 RepID=A0AAU9LMQ2_9ASTR|nr:unnamed protein product [Lactuca virosa]
MHGVKNVIGVDVPYGWNGVCLSIPWIVFVMFEDIMCCAPGVIIPWVVPRFCFSLLPRITIVGASVTIGIVDVGIMGVTIVIVVGVGITGITIGIVVVVGVTIGIVEVMMGVVGVTLDASVIDEKNPISPEVLLVTTNRSPKLGNDGICL